MKAVKPTSDGVVSEDAAAERGVWQRLHARIAVAVASNEGISTESSGVISRDSTVASSPS